MNPNKKHSVKEFIQAYERALKNQYGSCEPQVGHGEPQTMHVSFDTKGNTQYKVKPSKANGKPETAKLLNELEQINREHYLQVKIDRALEAGDKTLFMQLSSELNQLVAF